MITYKKTTNPNIILKIETIESEIYLDKLQAEIVDLEIKLNGMSKLIEKGEYPENILTLIDGHNARINSSEIQNELDRKKELLEKVK